MSRLPSLIASISILAVAPVATAAPRAASEPPEIASQQALIKRLEGEQLFPAYAEAQLELARRFQKAGRPGPALEAAQAAMRAYDQQVEAHKALSEVVMAYGQARAERQAARQAGLKRDEATYLAGELARALGQRDAAVRYFSQVVQSQPDQPLGERALVALAELGFLAAPTPVPPAPAPQ